MGTSDAERMENIRKTYHVEAFRGRVVNWSDRKGNYRGVIVGSRGSFLRVRRRPGRPPMWWPGQSPMGSRTVSLHPHAVSGI